MACRRRRCRSKQQSLSVQKPCCDALAQATGAGLEAPKEASQQTAARLPKMCSNTGCMRYLEFPTLHAVQAARQLPLQVPVSSPPNKCLGVADALAHFLHFEDYAPSGQSHRACARRTFVGKKRKAGLSLCTRNADLARGNHRRTCRSD